MTKGYDKLWKFGPIMYFGILTYLPGCVHPAVVAAAVVTIGRGNLLSLPHPLGGRRGGVTRRSRDDGRGDREGEGGERAFHSVSHSPFLTLLRSCIGIELEGRACLLLSELERRGSAARQFKLLESTLQKVPLRMELSRCLR